MEGGGRRCTRQGLIVTLGQVHPTGQQLKSLSSLTGLTFRTLPPPTLKEFPQGFLFEIPVYKKDAVRVTRDEIGGVYRHPPFAGSSRFRNRVGRGIS